MTSDAAFVISDSRTAPLLGKTDVTTVYILKVELCCSKTLMSWVISLDASISKRDVLAAKARLLQTMQSYRLNAKHTATKGLKKVEFSKYVPFNI